MPMWRCPHCGVPQTESSRCWVCQRSTTSCGTCRNFRRGVALNLGYCGLDRHHLALRIDEVRPCWERPSAAADPADRPLGRATARPSVPLASPLWLDEG